MKQYNGELPDSLAYFNFLNSILKPTLGQFSEHSSSRESLLTLLNAGIERQSQSDLSTMEKLEDNSHDSKSEKKRKKHKLHLEALPEEFKDKKRQKQRSTDNVDEPFAQQMQVVDANEPKHKKTKKQHKLAEEELNITHKSAGEKKRKKKHRADVNFADDRELDEIEMSSNITSADQPKKKKKHKGNKQSDVAANTDLDLSTSEKINKLIEVVKVKKKKHLREAEESVHDSITDQQANDAVDANREEIKRPKKIKKRRLYSTSSLTQASFSGNNENPEISENEGKHREKKKDVSAIKDADDDKIQKTKQPIENSNQDAKIVKSDQKTPNDRELDEIEMSSNITSVDQPKKKKKHKGNKQSDVAANTDLDLSTSEKINKLIEVVKVKKKKHLREAEESVHDSITDQQANDAVDANTKTSKSSKGEDDNGPTRSKTTTFETNADQEESEKRKEIYTSTDSDSLDMCIDDHLEKHEERKSLDSSQREILQDLNVELPFVIPPSHLIETRISSCPTREQKGRFEELEIKIRLTPYTAAEDNIIRSNWAEFSRTHDVPDDPTPFMQFTQSGQYLLSAEKRMDFVRFIGRNLPHRMLHSIYRRFKILFNDYKKGNFTPEEDKTIMAFVTKTNAPNKFATLGLILGRHRSAVKQHYEVLEARSKAKDPKVKWHLKQIEELIENLMKVTGKNVVDELRQATIEKHHWEQVERLMGIPAANIKKIWLISIYPQLFAENHKDLHGIQKKLINLLYNCKCDQKEILWDELALEFDGMTGKRLNKIFHNLLRRVPKFARRNFRDTVDYLNILVDTKETAYQRKSSILEYRAGKLIKK